MMAWSLAALSFAVLAALEASYHGLLQAQLPQPSPISSPKLVRDAIWVYECAGDGTPRLRPVYPFLLGSLLSRTRSDDCLATVVARLTLEMPHQEGNLKRILRELALSTWISRHWTAEQALDTYAALVWMGDNRHGVHEGAPALFGKAVNELSVADTALLVATIRSPRSFSPLCHPDRALRARNDVLSRLDRSGLVDHQEIATSLAAPLGVQGQCAASK